MIGNTVGEFRGDYAFLSNFYPSPFPYNGILYSTVENAFQAQKAPNVDLQREISNMSPGQAKREARSFQLPPNWSVIRVPLMRDLVWRKFLSNSTLVSMLLDTKDAYLVEGNDWGDAFWGAYLGHGKNMLGGILMEVRWGLKQGFTPFIPDLWISVENNYDDEGYHRKAVGTISRL